MAAGTRRRSSPSATARVVFAEKIVSGISRSLHNDELWTLYYFERHAAQCNRCTEPLLLADQGLRLCSEGNDLARDVAKLLYRRKDGHVYSKERESHQEVRIEMPLDYPQTTSLLQTIERSLKKGEKFLRARSSKSQRGSASPRSHHDSDSSSNDGRTTVRIIEPSSEDGSRRSGNHHRSYAVKEPTGTKRGSLYLDDLDELHRDQQREQELRYNVEVRQPAFLSARWTYPAHM